MKKMQYCPFCGNKLVPQVIDEVERLVCSDDDCDYIFWDNPTPVVAGIVDYNNRIVLIQNVGWPKQIFGLVTGFLEKGETPENGIIREVQEELGLETDYCDYIGLYAFKERNQLIIAYYVKARGEITMGAELQDIKIVEIDRLKPWPFGTGLAVKDWLENRKKI